MKAACRKRSTVYSLLSDAPHRRVRKNRCPTAKHNHLRPCSLRVAVRCGRLPSTQLAVKTETDPGHRSFQASSDGSKSQCLRPTPNRTRQPHRVPCRFAVLARKSLPEYQGCLLRGNRSWSNKPARRTTAQRECASSASC